jgi:hypothetical protein
LTGTFDDLLTIPATLIADVRDARCDLVMSGRAQMAAPRVDALVPPTFTTLSVKSVNASPELAFGR